MCREGRYRVLTRAIPAGMKKILYAGQTFCMNEAQLCGMKALLAQIQAKFAIDALVA